MYKMVAFDLDGTLLNDKKQISEEHQKLMKKINEDFVFTISTGRRYYSAKGFIAPIIDDLTIICNNGALIKSFKDDKCHSSHFLSYDLLTKIYEKIDSKKLNALIAIDHELYDVAGVKDSYTITGPDKRYYGERIKLIDELKDIEKESIISVIVHGLKEDLIALRDSLERDFPEGFNIYLMKIPGAEIYILEIHERHCSKWKSVVEYAETLGIKPEEIICVGDSQNDREMIEHAGLGIAMINALDEIKEIADVVTEFDNNDGGALIEACKHLY